MLVLNIDRHFHSMGLIKSDDGYRFAPIFDNGAALLSNMGIFHPDETIEDNIELAVSKPFCGSFESQAMVPGTNIDFDHEYERGMNMGRRGENIRKRNDGRWEARAVCGPPVDGKTNYKYLYSSSCQGAKDLKKEFLLNLDAMPKSALVSSALSPSTESASTELSAKMDEFADDLSFVERYVFKGIESLY